MKYLATLSFIVVMLVLTPSVFSQSQYMFEGYTSILSDELSDSGLTFNYTDGTCQIRMSSTNTFTISSTFTSNIGWFSPDGNTLGLQSLPININTSCKDYGTTSLKSVPRNGSLYETGITFTSSADSGFVTTTTSYLCQVPTNSVTVKVTRDVDRNGDCAYRNRKLITAGNRLEPWRLQLNSSYNECNGNFEDAWLADTCDNSTSENILGFNANYIYPFNSSGRFLNFSFTDANIIHDAVVATANYYIYLIDLSEGSTIELSTQLKSGGPGITFDDVTGSLTLKRDTQYLAVVHFFSTNGVNFDISFVRPPVMELEIFSFQGDFVCSPFTDCVNGTQTRTCVDQDGIAPDEIEARSCISVPFFENDLGFEQFVNQNVYTCQKQFLTCFDTLETINALYPVNWSTSGTKDFFDTVRQNFIGLTSDTSTVGSRSLKMWYIPPKSEEPVATIANVSLTECGNKTSGEAPSVNTGFNDTLFLVTNVSFPAPFIDLRYDVRKCAEPVVQYDYTTPFLPDCGKKCYGFNCTETPKGRYSIRLVNAVTSEIILDFFDTATADWRSAIIDLSNVGLEVGENYTLGIGINPDNVFESATHCAYFDNFRATLRTTEVGVCESQCQGRDLLQGIQQGNACIFKTITNAPQCAPDQNVAESFQSLETVCVGTTLVTFNNETGLWEELTENDLCIEQLNETITDVSSLEPTTGQEITNDIFEFILTKIFWAFVFTAIFFLLTLIATARLGQVSFEGAVVVAIISLVFFMTQNWIPLEAGALIALPIGLLAVYEYRKAT